MKLFEKRKKAMAEKAPTYRTRGDIQAEYGNICAQIGDKEVKIGFLKQEINLLQARCRQLNDEINALPAPAAEEKADGVTNPAQ